MTDHCLAYTARCTSKTHTYMYVYVNDLRTRPTRHRSSFILPPISVVRFSHAGGAWCEIRSEKRGIDHVTPRLTVDLDTYSMGQRQGIMHLRFDRGSASYEPQSVHGANAFRARPGHV